MLAFSVLLPFRTKLGYLQYSLIALVILSVLVVNSLLSQFENLRAAACKDRELAVNDQFGESLIFGPKIPFGELFSKIIFKSSSDFLILRDSQKFENAVKVRFFGQLKVQNKVRERSTAKYLK